MTTPLGAGCAAALVVSVVGLATPAAERALEPIARTVYVTALDAKGVPVTTLRAEDFSVKEGGKDREVTRAELATTRMEVAFIDDDNGSGFFRPAIVAFIQKVQRQADYAISVMVPQPMKVVDFTSNFQILADAISKLGPRPGTQASQVLAGVDETARDFIRHRAERPVIVVLTVGGDDPPPGGPLQFNTISSTEVLTHLQDSGANLNVFTARSMARPQSTADLSQLDDNRAVNEVLGDGPKQSGGRSGELLVSSGVVKGLQQLADELVTQYAVTYMLPDGVKPATRIAVSVKAKGVNLRAPTRIPAA